MRRLLPVAVVKEHFQLANGRLYKVLANGDSRLIQHVRLGCLVVRFQGADYFGVDLAWALYYGVTPMFPVFTLDGDPHNLAQENVVAARLKRLRFRAVPVSTPHGEKFKHAQAPLLRFSTREACHEDWLKHAREYYARDATTVRQMEDQLKGQIPSVAYARPKKARVGGSGRAAVENRPPKPMAVEGHRHYWYENQWVRVPEACHVADDFHERCRRVLAGAVRFAFNASTEMVEGLDADGVLVP